MDSQPKRIDITDRVYGKLHNGQMNLYLDRETIGEMVPTEHGDEVMLNNGFEYSHERFYQYTDTSKPVKQFVDDCDQGWC